MYFQEAPAPVLLPDACATRTTFYVVFFILISLIYGFKGRDATRPAYDAPEGKPNADVRIRVRRIDTRGRIRNTA